MIDSEVLAYLGERGAAAQSPMYAYIREWEMWWRGRNRAFHEYLENNAMGHPVRREMFRMNMAKKICEDWAAVLLNDRTGISVADEAGEAFVKKVFADSGFLRQANRLVEKAFAVGTGAAILRIADCPAENGVLLADERTRLSFEFVDAAHIIPLSVHNGQITEAAFVSEGVERGREYVYLETHTLEDGGYCIRNVFFDREDGMLKERDGGKYAQVIRTRSPVPFFAVLTPNIVNHMDEMSGMGMSVFADALDCLRGVDLAFNNFCRDIKLGGKKVFINQSLVQRDENGNVYTPDDVAQQLFVTIGDTDIAEHPMIAEHNPELRTADNAEAVQNQLDYLSFRCGLGTHHYTFGGVDGRTRLTATQYMGERQDMMQNAVKHQKNVEMFLCGMVRALLWCAAEVWRLPVDADAAVTVTFDDSFFTDTESQRSRDLDEVKAGILTAEEYRRKWIEV
ncbi:MAG: hypothetical protein IKU40_11960 [Clostridia bacterium]|nr:hypothetical protein [Clostridia bacterium]